MYLHFVGMSLKTCAADKCSERFEPYCIEQIYCSDRCRTRMGVRAHRDRLKHGGGDDGGGGRQRRLFPKQSVSAKRVKPPRPETAPLFTMSANGRHEKHVPLPDTQLYTLPVIGHCEDAEEQPFAPQVALPKPVQPVGVDLGGLDAAA